jgi:hypothetical protein
MVQTRGQTRMGATPPGSVTAFSTDIQKDTTCYPPKRRCRKGPAHQSENNAPEPPQQDETFDPPGSNRSQQLRENEHPDPPGVDPPESPCEDEHSNPPDNSGDDGTREVPSSSPARRLTLGVFKGNLGILNDVVSYITGLDLHHLILAMPVFRRHLRSASSLRPLVCQDSPVVPMLKHQDPTNFNLLTFQRVPLLQPTLCTTPATSVIPLKRCEGHALGYSGQDGVPDHGPNFLVCQHCVQKAWEAYSIFVKSRGVDLCYTCSREHRRRNAPPIRPPNYPRQCTCVWDDKVWLCRTCRMAKANEDLGIAMHWFQSQSLSNFVPMHAADQGAHPRDYIDPESRNGESYCLCGMTVQGKIASYGNDHPNFRPLVRLCIYCSRERFLTDSRLD